jgi:tetratricopeptide (TPR) repeat protein
MKLVVVTAALAILTAAIPAVHADGTHDKKARELFEVGRAAYNRGDYQTAYDSFRESFQLSHQPDLLYNIASALQGLRRPHDAAEALRSYMRLRPEDPERSQIEDRIRTLEEEQRLMDRETKAKPPSPPTPVPPPSQTVVLVAPPPATGPSERERRRRTTGLAVGLTVGAVVVVAGVTIGLVLGLKPTEEPLTPSPVGPIKSTP